MPAAQDPRDPGRHLLGPHVVGQRIVVRRLVRGETGPTGGPAMTDLLGICLAWEDGVCLVQPESGEPVPVAVGDIVSGKPVPPRPSVRMRVPARDAELHTASLWPSVETFPLGEWVLRTDTAPVGRLRRRANSCLAMGDPGMAFEDAAAAVRDFYAERGRPPYVQVELGSELEAAFIRSGWQVDPTGDAELRLAALTQVRRRLRAVGGTAGLAADGPRALATMGDGGSRWARGEAAVDGDWLGIHSLEVAPAHRRQGLATAVTAELLEWGAEQGATTVWLHVETDNAPALAFYDGLGLARHHTCRYLRPAGSPAPATR
ncbi:MAG TPA: GNAT family N-acetyltransferase [Nocardioides sp.]|nr:GNAT family N-acetyltransferase [Nocardioides sp.]